jgi:hypothetical protein
MFRGFFKQYTPRNWIEDFDKLDSFAKLKIGWDGYSARCPEVPAIRSAKLFLSQLSENDPVPHRVKPSVVGGIGITFRSQKRKCYVEFYNNGTVYSLFSDGQSDPDTAQVPPTIQNYKLLISAIRDYLNAGNS